MKQQNLLRSSVLLFLMIAAAFSRLIPHPQNFAPIGALGLFGAAYFRRKGLAFLLPLFSLWLSDLFLDNVIYAEPGQKFSFFYEGFYWIYGAIALSTLLGFYTLKKVNFGNVLLSSLLASLLFYLLTNYACFPGSKLYPQNFAGLMECYAAGIPYAGGTVLGNLFYSLVLFGGFELVLKKVPSLQEANVVS